MAASRNMWRQGDVLLLEVEAIPPEASEAPDLVVAHGEMTGHRHRFESAARRLLARDGTQYVEVVGDFAELVHEEHGTIRLPRGLYRVKIQREYVPGAFRTVLD
jgi:hypothetical protein